MQNVCVKIHYVGRDTNLATVADVFTGAVGQFVRLNLGFASVLDAEGTVITNSSATIVVVVGDGCDTCTSQPLWLVDAFVSIVIFLNPEK